MSSQKTRRAVIRRLLPALLLAALTILPASAHEIQGYTSLTGSVYIAYGSFTKERSGEPQPLVWRVLTVQDGSAYLMSEYILEARPVHSGAQYTGWTGSDLAAYLNGAFRKAAFTPAERYALVRKDDCTVTLPAAEDLKNADYGFISAASRQAQSTAYAKSTGLYDYGGAKRYSPYWTRTPAQRPGTQRRVMLDGALGYYAVSAADIGVRPALWLNLGRAAIAGGSGTLIDPYTMAIDTAGMPEEPEETQMPRVATATPGALPEATPAATQKPLASREFPRLNAQGFLDTGEYIYENEKDGLWQYASPTLRVIIRRYEEPAIPLRRYEAEIFAAPREAFRVLPFSPGDTSAAASPGEIAAVRGAIYAQNADGYFRRVNTTTHHAYAGIIIRGGKLLYDDPPPQERTLFPLLDVLALLPGGEMRVFAPGENTAAAYLAAGAVDVLSYGPYLIKDGVIPPRAADYGVTAQARSGIGRVGPGHYFGIVAEGPTDKSAGVSAAWMASRFMELGCETAFNLEGGDAAAMLFLGKQLNQAGIPGSLTGIEQNEILGIGGK
jgi:hypothetical protein